MHDTASEFYDELLRIYFDEYYCLSDTKRKKSVANINVKSYLLKDIIIMTGIKM